jgi:hypothetical protein
LRGVPDGQEIVNFTGAGCESLSRKSNVYRDCDDCAATRRPGYRDMTLTFAIALGEVLKSQRQRLKDSNDLTSLRSVHPLPVCGAAQVRQDLQWLRHAALPLT